jgi:hypothetical protein
MKDLKLVLPGVTTLCRNNWMQSLLPLAAGKVGIIDAGVVRRRPDDM